MKVHKLPLDSMWDEEILRDKKFLKLEYVTDLMSRYLELENWQ